MKSAEIQSYGNKLQRRLRLNQWAITYHVHQVTQLIDMDLENPYACVEYDTVERTATIHLAQLGEDDAVREHLRHEMVHIALAEMCCMFDHVIGRLGAEAQDVMRGQHRNAVERAVRDLTDALADRA